MKKFAITIIALTIGSVDVIRANEKTDIVVISGQDVMMNSETGKAVQEKLQKEQAKLAEPLRKEAEKIQKDEQALIEKSKKPEADASALEYEKRELALRIQKLNADGQSVEKKLSEIYQKEMTKFQGQLQEAIKDLAQKNDWKVVLMEEQTVYAHPSSKKTEMVIVELDKKTKAANLAKKQAIEEKSKSASSNSTSSGSKSA